MSTQLVPYVDWPRRWNRRFVRRYTGGFVVDPPWTRLQRILYHGRHYHMHTVFAVNRLPGTKPPDSSICTFNEYIIEKNYCRCCRKSAPIICPECRSLWYCSTECQQQDAALHAIICRAIRDRFLTIPDQPVDQAIFMESLPAGCWSDTQIQAFRYWVIAQSLRVPLRTTVVFRVDPSTLEFITVALRTGDAILLRFLLACGYPFFHNYSPRHWTPPVVAELDLSNNRWMGERDLEEVFAPNDIATLPDPRWLVWLGARHPGRKIRVGRVVSQMSGVFSGRFGVTDVGKATLVAALITTFSAGAVERLLHWIRLGQEILPEGDYGQPENFCWTEFYSVIQEAVWEGDYNRRWITSGGRRSDVSRLLDGWWDIGKHTSAGLSALVCTYLSDEPEMLHDATWEPIMLPVGDAIPEIDACFRL